MYAIYDIIALAAVVPLSEGVAHQQRRISPMWYGWPTPLGAAPEGAAAPDANGAGAFSVPFQAMARPSAPSLEVKQDPGPGVLGVLGGLGPQIAETLTRRGHPAPQEVAPAEQQLPAQPEVAAPTEQTSFPAQPPMGGENAGVATAQTDAKVQPPQSKVACPTKTEEEKKPIDWSVLPKADKVHLEVYYETLCPFCQKLFVNGFGILNDPEFRERVTLDLYPFGNAKIISEDHISEWYHFWHEQARYPLVVCQHGESECLGNVIQACALDMYGAGALPYILCMEEAGKNGHGIELASGECSKQGTNSSTGVDLVAVKECATSKKGDELIAGLGARSLAPELNRSYVPWVMVNGAHAELEEDHTLVGPICNAMTPPLPAACSPAMGGAAQVKFMAVPCHGVSCTAAGM